MATRFFISPKYNVGERAAGGTVTIYTDKTMQVLEELWEYADLTLAPDGTGIIANPVPVDNWGIDSSPIFFRDNPKAYYVIKRATGDVLREGFVYPLSWLDGGTPPVPEDPWSNAIDGDPYWGYEVIADANALATHAIVDRPLWLSAPNKRDGVVVWNVPSNGVNVDNVIAFASSINPNFAWKVRDEYVRYSYLENAIGSGTNPFTYLENNWKGEYNVRLDIAPKQLTGNITQSFSSKVLIDPNITMDGASSYTLTVELRGENLELRKPLAWNVQTSYQAQPNFIFKVRGGVFKLSEILSSNVGTGPTNYSNFVTGKFDAIVVDTIVPNVGSMTLSNIDVDLWDGSGLGTPFVPQGATLNASYVKISKADVNVIGQAQYGQPQTLIPGMIPTKTLRVSSNASIQITTEFANAWLEIESINGAMLFLYDYQTTGPVRFNVRPSKYYIYNKTLEDKILNAEFFSEAVPDSSITSSNLFEIGRNTTGVLELNETNSNKLLLYWAGIKKVVSKGFRYIYVKSFSGEIIGAGIVFRNTYSTTTDTFYQNGDLEATNCYIYFENDGVNGIGAGQMLTVFYNTKFNNCHFYLEATNINNPIYTAYPQNISLEKCIVEHCTFSYSNEDLIDWNGFVFIGNNTKMAACRFRRVSIAFKPEIAYDKRYGLNVANLNNIDLDIEALSDNCYLVMPYAVSKQGLKFSNRYACNFWIFTNVRISSPQRCMNVTVGTDNNYRYRFAPVVSDFIGDGTGTSTDKWMRGHIEIDGDFDYTQGMGTGGALMATGEFPDINWVNRGLLPTPWNGGEVLSQICVHVFGDPLKYTHADGGYFVTADPWHDAPPTYTWGTQQQIEALLNSQMTNPGQYGTLKAFLASTPDDKGVNPYLNPQYLGVYTGLAPTFNGDIETIPSIDWMLNGNGVQGTNDITNIAQSIVGSGLVSNTVYYFLTPIANKQGLYLATVYPYNSGTNIVTLVRALTPDLSDPAITSYSPAFALTSTASNKKYVNDHPIPRTNYVVGISWTDTSYNVSGTTMIVYNCLLCCDDNVHLYRIRE